jgi:hypothetical protein
VISSAVMFPNAIATYGESPQPQWIASQLNSSGIQNRRSATM